MSEEAQMTEYSLNKQIAEQLEILDVSDPAILDKLNKAFLNLVYSSRDRVFVLMAPDIRYLTIFIHRDMTPRKSFAEYMAQFIVEEHENLGGLKSIDWDDDLVELWIGNEVYRVFPYDFAVEEY